MARLAREASKTLPVRLAALQLVEKLPQHDRPGEIRALFEFVRDRIRYVRDIRGVETIQTPERTLQLKQGDCDDQSTLLAALLLSIGHPARFHAIGFRPGRFSHVFTEVYLGNRWIPLETTENWDPGRSSKSAVEHMVLGKL